MKAHQSPPAYLASLASLRSAWLKARTSEQREAICNSIESAFKGYRSRFTARAREQPNEERDLFERRLLVLAAHPISHRDELGRKLDAAQESAWRELSYLNSKTFVTLLKRHVRTTDSCIREHAAKHLAEIGSDELAPLVVRLLRDEDMRVVYAAAWGTLMAARCKCLSNSSRTKIFDALAHIATGERSLPPTDAGERAIMQACEALIGVDTKRAIALLTSEACLRPNNRSIRGVAVHLAQTRAELPGLFRKPVDPDFLWPLFVSAHSGIYHKLRGDRKHWAWYAQCVAGSILMLTADGDPIRTRRECLAIIKSKPERSGYLDDVRLALRRCKNIPDTKKLLDRFFKQRSSFSKNAASILHAYELAEHILSDGLHLYFSNLGLYQTFALDGLKAMKLTATAKLLQKAAKLVGPEAKHESSKVREAAIDSLPEATQNALFAIEEQFDKHCQLIFSAVDRAIAAKPEQFRASRA